MLRHTDMCQDWWYWTSKSIWNELIWISINWCECQFQFLKYTRLCFTLKTCLFVCFHINNYKQYIFIKQRETCFWWMHNNLVNINFLTLLCGLLYLTLTFANPGTEIKFFPNCAVCQYFWNTKISMLFIWVCQKSNYVLYYFQQTLVGNFIDMTSGHLKHILCSE